ncbi:MAG: ABC transporter permease [Puniceicoccales bacterium]|jgi:ABC-2 type transport system permease protein|nr:ABC transporter permease [Puniceicoccales bacterium]
MKNIWTLFKYETYRLIVSPSTHVISLIFSLSLVAIFAFLLREYTVCEQDVPFAHMFFRYCWLSMCAAAALITMRSFSEEYRSGTFQSLFSAPIAPIEAVLSKFFATYLLLISLWLCTLPLLASVGIHVGSVFYDAAFAAPFNIVGGISFMALSGLLFVAVGIFSSSLTENQVIASMATFCILVPFFINGHVLGNGSKISNFRLFDSFSEAINAFVQLDNFCSGVIDSRAVVFYVSSSVAVLCMSAVAVRRKLN